MINKPHIKNLRGDIYGGVTAAVVALPLALAFGVSSGAGPIAGLYGAIFVGFFAALFGGTNAQVSGPTGPMTVVMAGVFTEYVSYDPVLGPALAFTVVMMGGLMQIAMGYMRIGTFINLVPAPVISGFMSGIGVIIILLQIGPLLGHSALGSPLESAKAIPDIIASPVPDALMLGVIALAIVYLLPAKISKYFPGPLMALVVGTLALVLFLPNSDATSLGEIPTGFPDPKMPTMSLALLPGMLKSAFILAVLGAIDSLLTSLVADNVTREQHDSNKELIGQGIGNTIAGIFGGLPGAGATMRTVVNVRAGGRTPISGSLHALVLLAIVLGFGAQASHIPHAVLAGILIKVGTDIIDWDYIKRIGRTSWVSVGLMLMVMFLTIFVDLISAVGFGMILASFMFMKRMTDLQLQNIKAITEPGDELPLTDDESAIMKEANGRILLFYLSGPMSFPAAKGMVRYLSTLLHYESLLLDVSDVSSIDYTSTRALEDMILNAQHDGKEVYLVGATNSMRKQLEQQHVMEHINEAHDLDKRIDALKLAAKSLDMKTD